MLLHCAGASIAGRLAPVNLSVNPGERVHLVGPNGAGKSTLLAVLAGMLTAQGSITLDGATLDTMPGAVLARQRAWLPQQQAPVALPVWHYLRLHSNAASAQADKVLHTVLSQLNLQHKLTASLSRLSGGEWQRVRLAAVVLQIHPTLNPRGRLLILDEPMTALDIAQQRAVDNLLTTLCQAGIAVVASGHDLNHSLRQADRVWLMHQGSVVSQGTAQTVLTPEQLAPLYNTEFRLIKTDHGPLLILP